MYQFCNQTSTSKICKGANTELETDSRKTTIEITTLMFHRVTVLPRMCRFISQPATHDLFHRLRHRCRGSQGRHILLPPVSDIRHCGLRHWAAGCAYKPQRGWLRPSMSYAPTGRTGFRPTSLLPSTHIPSLGIPHTAGGPVPVGRHDSCHDVEGPGICPSAAFARQTCSAAGRDMEVVWLFRWGCLVPPAVADVTEPGCC